MRWSEIAGTGRKGTLTGLNNSLLKMKRDKAPRTGGALFRFVYMWFDLAGLAGGLPCQSFCVLLPGVGWRSLLYSLDAIRGCYQTHEISTKLVTAPIFTCCN